MKTTAYAQQQSRKHILTTGMNMETNHNALRMPDPELETRMRAQMRAANREREVRIAELPAIRVKGEKALRRLLPVAQRDTGQSMVIARFLLNLYNGERFPFDMTDLRRLDFELFDDCMAVLRMDFQPQKEVHLYFENGSTIWEALAKEWGFKDYTTGTTWR
jgi:hypothetical protein